MSYKFCTFVHSVIGNVFYNDIMKHFFCVLTLFLCVMLFSCCTFDNSLKVYDLRCENLVDPLAIDNTEPHFSWKIHSSENRKQYFYRIIAGTDRKEVESGIGKLWDTGVIESAASVMLPYEGRRLQPSSFVYWKVKVWDNEENESPWSPVARFGVGLLNNSGWTAKYIGLRTEDNEMVQSPLLRKSFDITKKEGLYLLHVNSLGYHEIYLNGKKMGEDVLSPAVSQLDKRSLSVTYDLTGQIKKGKNDLILWLGQGWYKKGLFYNQIDNGPWVKAQLEVLDSGTNSTVLVTDESWRGRESGYSDLGEWLPHRFGGERIDARNVLLSFNTKDLDEKDWIGVTTTEIKDLKISPQMCEPNRIQNTIKPSEMNQIADGVWMIDMGTTLNGWMEVKFPRIESGREIILEYADHFNQNGDMVVEQKDIYIASGKSKEVFCNKFNYHSFRYLRISNLPENITKENLTAYLIYPDFNQTASFECSDPDINAIHDMIQYTFQCLTLGGYLVDCPHLERLGYGGDGNASTQTIQTMYDVSPLYYNWMQAWNDFIKPDGSLAHVAPSPYSAGGGPYWCAFVIMGSWRTYVNYADDRLIRKHYPMMQQWLAYAEKYMENGLLKPWPNTEYRNWYLGDWATPKGIDQTNEKSVSLVNNTALSVSYDYMVKIARLLGKKEDEKEYIDKKENLKNLIHSTFFDENNNSYATGTQIDLAYPMLAGVAPDHLIEEIETQFEKETENKKGHLSTGLVGVPVITEWVTKNNKVDLMYSMLKKRDYPSYLYMIDNGATTTWEHWNGERSRIHNCYNGIGSWFYEAIGGICPDENAPGFKHFYICPQMPEGMIWANVSKETPYGVVKVNWKIESSLVSLNITVPSGSAATLIIPKKISEYTLNEASSTTRTAVLADGVHSISWKQ